jgi:hypothetical protein
VRVKLSTQVPLAHVLARLCGTATGALLVAEPAVLEAAAELARYCSGRPAAAHAPAASGVVARWRLYLDMRALRRAAGLVLWRVAAHWAARAARGEPPGCEGEDPDSGAAAAFAVRDCATTVFAMLEEHCDDGVVTASAMAAACNLAAIPGVIAGARDVELSQHMRCGALGPAEFGLI